MITINEHNYEMYLLLLLDKELLAEEQAVVWAYMNEHDWVRAEFELLQQAYLTHEPGEEASISLPDSFKQGLLSPGEKIHSQNYTEFFAAYVDDELSETEKNEVEEFIALNPAYESSFIGYSKTKLVPEVISYPNKKELLKPTEKNRRAIPLFIRFSVAAAVVSICAVQAYRYFQNTAVQNDDSTSVAITKPAEKIPATKPNSTAELVLPKALNNTAESKVSTNALANTSSKKNIGKTITEKNAVEKSTSAYQTNTDMAAIPTTNTKQDELADVSMETAMQKVRLLEATELEINNEKKLLEERNISNSTAYNLVNTDEDNSMYVGALELNKTKVKSLLKRAGNILGIGRPANKPSIGKEPIQIASFEIDPNKKTTK